MTPSSKVVGDLALHLVAVGADPAEFEANPAKFDIPDSVIGFLSGELGDPPGGWPEPFRTKALAGPHRASRPSPSSTDEQRAGLRRATGARTLNELLFPGPTKEFARVAGEVRRRVGAARPSTTSTGCAPGEEHEVELEEGKRLLLGLEAISEPDERGIRTVMCTINGQLRPVNVRDRAVAADVAGRREGRHRRKPGHVAAPFDGRGHRRGRRGRRGRGRRRPSPPSRR